MNKTVLNFLMLFVIITSHSCKIEKKENPQTLALAATVPESSLSKPKTYVVTASPESVFLGENKEALVKIKDLNAIELANQDGTSGGIELTYKIELTNKNEVGGNSIVFATTDFRLELDNGNKIQPSSIFVNVEADTKKLSNIDKFIIPVGAKPKVLNLFYDQTRATMKLELK
jgi:hypothetical protein